MVHDFFSLAHLGHKSPYLVFGRQPDRAAIWRAWVALMFMPQCIQVPQDLQKMSTVKRIIAPPDNSNRLALHRAPAEGQRRVRRLGR